jgi:hypothetical protein
MSEMERIPLSDKMQALRCDHDGLKMAEVKNGHLVLRTKHHGETHVKIVSLAELERTSERTHNAR